MKFLKTTPIRSFLLVSALAAAMAAFAPVSASAQGIRPDVEMAYTNDKPLMVVRFNQRMVHYERSLYGAVSQAVNAKPSVMFELVAASPMYGDRNQQQKLHEMAGQAGSRVLGTMRDMGVPQSRMSYNIVSDPSIDYPEVRVYVR